MRLSNERPGDERPRVLVASDNAKLRQYVVRLLGEHYRTDEVGDGQAALASALEQTPDLILTGMTKPPLDGDGLLTALRADPRTSGVPVILLTADAGEDTPVEGMPRGADDFLVQPFSARELLARVAVQLKKGRQRRESSAAILASNVTASEVTARKRHEDSTLQALVDIIEVCPFGIYIVDQDLRITTMNVGSQEGAFASVRPVVGRRFDEVVRVVWPEPVAAKVIEIFQHTLTTGESYHSRNFRHARADVDQTESYEFEVHRVSLPNGRYGAVCYYFDSTQLRDAERKLSEADRQKDEFLAILAHELRNPLAPLRNGVRLMRLTQGDADASERTLSMMERQVEQMVHLLDDLLDVSRVTRGTVTLRKERLELTSAVAQAIEAIRPFIDQGGHKLVVDVPRDPIHVDGDPTRLAQVFTNLLNNAVKYTPRGGHIRVAVQQVGAEAVVSVTDDGIGIPTNMLSQIFEMFSQGARNVERPQSGLGIGLSIVSRLIELHGGSVEARSGGEGLGSEFIVRLPAGVSHVEPAPPDEATMLRATAAYRILVVDDNVDLAESLAMLLTFMGHETRMAYDGLEALDVAAAFRPTVMLLDIGLPKLDGLEVCRRIRQQAWGEDMFVIALTGWGQEADKRKTLAAGADAHLVKPVAPDALERLLAQLTAGTA